MMDDMEVESHLDAIVPIDDMDVTEVDTTEPVAVSPLIEPHSKERIPVCAPEFIPIVGLKFDTLEEGMQFYDNYSANSGFKMRKTTQRKEGGIVISKYCVCSKAGESKPKGHVIKRRKTRISCNAKVYFRKNKDGKFEIQDFHEGHTHLLSTPRTAVHLTENRALTLLHKSMIFENSKVNKGPVQTFRMFKEYVKGYHNIGASLEDFKNYWRDVKQFIKGYDAQMMIESFMYRKAMCPSFFFDFDVDERGRLSKVFWADPIAIKNYSLFGDTTSFDTTFNMNTYKMIFAPFTGIDEHKRCVSFGAGLLRKETDNGFEWLFKAFLSAMGDKYPKCIITDQDLGIKAGVKAVFGDKTRHRHCMWHIMKKVPDKIGSTVYKDTRFLKDICACVWSEDIEPEEFEERWCSVISTYGLDDNEWLTTMYNLRASWIPAYFRDTFLAGLMRTTSRSESENSFFGNFMNPNLTLVEFLLRFDSAMDAQRWCHLKLIADSKNTFPDLDTPHPMEKHASEFYTPAIFADFQTEWKAACYTCARVMGTGSVENMPIIDHADDKVSYVAFDSDGARLKCSCKKFSRHGLLCRHSLYVLKEQGFDKIPEHYLLRRWSRLATCQPVDGNVPDTLNADCNTLEVQKFKIGNLWSEVFTCVTLAEQKPEYIDEFMELLKSFKDKMQLRSDQAESSGSGNRRSDRTQKKNKELEMLLGVKIPKKVVILNPIQSKTKGSGKRMISKKEQATKAQQKPGRKCNACGEIGLHDSRNCPGRA